MPRVSVLLPAYDAAPTLPECLESLSTQTLEDHEVIAVDDGSRDGTAAVLASHARTDRRLRVVRTPHRGLAAALNTALEHARAPVVARMDADDVCLPGRLQVQQQRLDDDPETTILGCGVRLIGGLAAKPNGGMRAYVDWLNGLDDHETIARDLYVESPVAHPSVLMRTAALRALGGYRDFHGPEDYDLWLRAFERGFRFAKVPQVLLAWRDSEGRLTRRDARYSADRFLALKLDSLQRGLLRGRREVVIWGAGEIGKSWARALRERSCAVAAFVEVDPRKIHQRVHGVPVVPVEGAAALRGALHLAAVAGEAARDRIRQEAARLGLGRWPDVIAVA